MIKSNFRRVHSFSWFLMHAHWLRNDCTDTSRVYVNSKRKNFSKLFVLFLQKESNFLVAFFFFFFFFLSSLFCRLIEWVRYCNYFFFFFFLIFLFCWRWTTQVYWSLRNTLPNNFPFKQMPPVHKSYVLISIWNRKKLLTKYIAFRAHFKFPLVKPAARQTNSRVRRRSTEICDTARVSWQLKIPCALDIPAQASTWTWWSKSNLKYFLKISKG